MLLEKLAKVVREVASLNLVVRSHYLVFSKGVGFLNYMQTTGLYQCPQLSFIILRKEVLGTMVKKLLYERLGYSRGEFRTFRDPGQ